MTSSLPSRKGENTKQRILQSASKLFDEKGYFGTGMNDILFRADAPKGSMYFHFPGGKEEIAIQAIQASGSEIARLLEAGFEGADNPEEAVNQMISYFKMRLTGTKFSCGCPISTVGLELSGSNSPVLAACRDTYAEWSGLLQQYLNRFVAEKLAGELANAIFSQIQGALLLSRITGELSHLDIAAKNCINLVHEAVLTSNPASSL